MVKTSTVKVDVKDSICGVKPAAIETLEITLRSAEDILTEDIVDNEIDELRTYGF
ncbi:predicted protein [Botrytis cinerea T4]|uniref:Uncharacterized protein n=1 Tax=Botryotinia fuckeliana (strain T4) TaxID=999810 RepID=G2YGP0_BOTF4|nr:predicted protein [Botrytis cinerea T4]